MDGATVQKRIYGGYTKAALRLGTSFDLFRPQSALNPMSQGNRVGTMLAAFSTDPDFRFKQPSAHGKPLWYALLDGQQVLPGDYLTNGVSTWFVADQQALSPIPCITCNRTLTVLRPYSASGVGALPYGGDTASLETPVMTAWPGAVLQGTRGEKGDTQLPGDVRLPWYSILLPAYPGAPIKAFDVAVDEAGQRYKVASTELTSLGWRLTASLAQT